MSKSVKMASFTSFVLLLSALLLPLHGAVATETITSGAIFWEPLGEYEALTLTVSGPGGGIYRAVFGAGDEVSFDLKDGDGNPLPDGTYNYELVATPSAGAETEPQSGVFTISGGSAVDPSVEEGEGVGLKATNGPKGPDVRFDFVINDDLIVDGSACIGFDCVNGENFGFDTLRLKENNLRVHFDDTSVAASFPRNDWRIIINDSANGGASYFGIEDSTGGRIPFRIEAGAPANALFVEDSGDIGLGTSTPSLELHIADGDTPTVRLDQNGTSGWTPQTWDLAGNETNFFVRDVTNGSKLPFRIRPNAPTSSIDVEGTTGDIGIGLSSPTAPLHVRRSNGTSRILVEETDGTTAARVLLTFENNGLVQYDMTDTSVGGAGTWSVFTGGTPGAGTFHIDKPGGVQAFIVDENGGLTVAGSFNVAGVPLNVPDYVFEADYQLMPLEDLNAFIKENKHLPNVPSKSDVKKAGNLDMTEMQLKLLEKVEELTLYTLQQQQTIESLKDRLDDLEKLRSADD